MTATEQNIEYLMPGLKHGKFIQGLLHTPEYSGYKTLRLIQGAVDFRGKLPKRYTEDEEYYYVVRDFGIDFTKGSVKALREEFVNEIIKVIVELDKTDDNQELLPDHYGRLFHALAILKVPKDTKLLPGTTTNLIYNAMYMMWALDDGSLYSGDIIQRASWYMAEEIKKRLGTRTVQDDDLLIGIRL